MFKRRRQPEPAPIGVGVQLNARYRLVEQVGQGGAGIIFKAQDEQLARTVAIKLFTAAGGLAADVLERFWREARSVARLNHPNIITLYDYDLTNGRPYLVMEFVPGQDLWALDSSYSPKITPFAVSLPIIDGILAALEYSHQQGIIHRDLKPENVMITPQGQVKVMDFGLARIRGQSRLTRDGLVAGTASYLAPELAVGEEGDHRADLYALGVMMYELATGRLPFSGDDPLTVVSQHIHAPVVPPQRFNPDIPTEWQRIMLTAMAKDPAQRYATAADIRTDLAPVLAWAKGERPSPAQTGDKPGAAPKTSSAEQVILDRLSRGKMIGREAELAALKHRWDQARLGEPDGAPLLFITGEAGIGKSRLLREAQVYAGLRDGYILRGAAQEQAAGAPFALFAGLIRQYVQDQPPDVLRRHSRGFIAAEVVKLAPQLAQKIGPVPPNPSLEPEAERARLLEQISAFLLAAAAAQPTVLLLDDLHFADPGSLDLLQALVQQAAGTPLLVVAAYEDVALSRTHPVTRLTAALNAANLAVEMPLARLTQALVDQMLEALLGEIVGEEFVASVYQATEGNPLFVEEVVKGLATDGQIILRQGRWERRDPDRLHVPGSIKSVLGGRLAHVKKDTLDLLQLAAVIGRTFSLEALAAVCRHTTEQMQWAIEEALRFELIEVSRITDVAAAANPGIAIHYQFQHALIRQTLLDDLRPLRRRRLHHRVAVALKQLPTAPPPAVLAHHFVAAGMEEAASPYLHRAGKKALKVYAHKDAVQYFRQARHILEDVAPDLNGPARRVNLRRQYELLNLERRILNLLGSRGSELDVLQQLLAVAEALADKRRWVEAMSRQAAYYWQVGRLNQADNLARKALAVAQAQNDRRGQAHCLEQIARVLWTRRHPDSMVHATRALAIAKELGDRGGEGRLTELVGHIYADTLHDAHRAAIYFDQALEISRETGHRIEEAWTLWGMGGLALLISNYPAALARFHQAHTIAREIGASLQAGWDMYGLGDAWYNLGNPGKAQEYYEQAQIIFNDSRHVRGKIYALVSLGLVFSARDQMDEAITYLEQAIQQAEARDDQTLMYRSYQALAVCYRRRGDDDSLALAIRLSNRIIKLAVEAGHYEHELLGYYLRAMGYLALAEPEAALNSSNIAVQRLERLNYFHSPQISTAEIWHGHSQILAALGQTEPARIYRQKAVAETLRKADLIADPHLRQEFLEKVPSNREILESG